MARNKRIAFTIPEELWKGLSALAGTFGVSAEEVVRQSLPDDAVVGLFFQCRVYEPQLKWDEVAQAGRAAIREQLRETYMKGLQEHVARLGVSLESSAEDVEGAKKRVLDELMTDGEQAPKVQIAKAEEDSVYLGCLYEAWKYAKAGRPGYAISEVEIQGAAPDSPHKAWAVLKDGRIV
ncbi:MAG: hypothetical protein ABFE01_21400 [Phycisphaerales bacterium]